MSKYDLAIQYFQEWLNWFRFVSGTNWLWHNQSLSENCQRHNDWMARSDCFTHSSAPTWGENIAYLEGNFSPVDAMEMLKRIWQSCPDHRSILLSNATSFGLAIYWLNGKVYATFRLER